MALARRSGVLTGNVLRSASIVDEKQFVVREPLSDPLHLAYGRLQNLARKRALAFGQTELTESRDRGDDLVITTTASEDQVQHTKGSAPRTLLRGMSKDELEKRPRGLCVLALPCFGLPIAH